MKKVSQSQPQQEAVYPTSATKQEQENKPEQPKPLTATVELEAYELRGVVCGLEMLALQWDKSQYASVRARSDLFRHLAKKFDEKWQTLHALTLSFTSKWMKVPSESDKV